METLGIADDLVALWGDDSVDASFGVDIWLSGVLVVVAADFCDLCCKGAVHYARGIRALGHRYAALQWR